MCAANSRVGFHACNGVALSAPNDLVRAQHGGFWFIDHGKVSASTVDRGFISRGITMDFTDGRQIEHVPLQDRFTTNLCFAADGAHRAYVTLACKGRLVSAAWPPEGPSLNH